MLQENLDQEKEPDKKQKTDQDLVISLINLAVQRDVFAVSINHRNDESDEKTSGENQLALAEHDSRFCCKSKAFVCKS